MRIVSKAPIVGWLLLLGLAFVVAGPGCGDKKKQPPAVASTAGKPEPEPVAAAAAPAEEPAKEISLVDTYIYTPVGKRDPFKSSYKDVSGVISAFEGSQGPLQRYEIDQLKLIAVISGISQPRAMVTVPDGKGYTVRIGTRIGKNYGRVVRIKTAEVIIAEDYRDWNGRKVTNYIHMSLKKDEKKRM